MGSSPYSMPCSPNKQYLVIKKIRLFKDRRINEDLRIETAYFEDNKPQEKIKKIADGT